MAPPKRSRTRSHGPRGAKTNRRTGREERRRTVRTIIWIAVTLAALGAAYPEMRRIPHDASHIHFEAIRRGVVRLGALAPAAAVLVIIAHVFIPLPGEAVLAVMGALFGFWRGLFISWLGNMIGAVVAFELGRALGPNRQPRTVPAKALKWVDSRIRRGDWRAAIVIRFVPLFPVSVFNFALGRTSVSLVTFLWTSALGFVPMNAVLVAFGYGATGAAEMLPWATGALAAMLIAGLIYRYRIAPAPRPA